MLKPKPTLVKKSQGLYSQLRQARESGQGIVTYHFEEKKEFHDYSKYDLTKLTKNQPLPKPQIIEEVGKKWSQQQSINQDIFFTSKGKFEDLEKVAEIFKNTAHDLGAKYFTI